MHTCWYSDTVTNVEAAIAPHAFVFADLVGYTALAAVHGDERAADVATRFHTAVRGLVHREADAEIKTLGDGVMLRVGDPGRAVRLGVEITAAVAALEDIPAVRVGIHTGPAVHRDGDWYGTTVNVASRLCDAADSGQVLVSDAAAVAAGPTPGVDFGAPELHRLKNLTAPIPARAAQPAAPPPVPRRTELRLALARLRERLEARPCLAGQWMQGAH